MKKIQRSISRLCYVSALMLGLFAAWGATAPQVITGEQIAGGWPACLNVSGNTTCGDAYEGAECDRYWAACTGTSDDLQCSDIRASSCNGSAKCAKHKDQACN